MKKIFYMLSLAGVMSLSSCTDLDENLNGKLFADNFYNDETQLEMANGGMFKLLEKNLCRPYESFEIKFAAADDVIGTGNQRLCYNQVERNMPRTVEINTDVQAAWERSYGIINTANGILNNLKNAEGKVSEERMAQFEAQARFVRAWTYFWVVRFCNNIPLVTDAFTGDSNREVTVSKAADVYKLIVEDLQFAEKNLPKSWAASNNLYHSGGIPTEGTAKSLLAKVYLQMAGFPINGGNEYYGLAAAKAKEVIDNAFAYGYGLRTHYWENWEATWTPYQQATEEAIFFIPYGQEDGSVRSPNPSRPVEFSGWESMVAELGFYNRFPEGERKEFTFITEFNAPGNPTLSYTDLQAKHPFYRKLYADDLAGDWSWEGRATNNWATDMTACGSWYNQRDLIVLRYADILLTYAEAKARTDGPDALAYQCLNDVRNRAYKGLGTNEASVSGLSTEDFIDTVVWERAFEFAGFEYSARWFDLVRLELVEKANTEWREETEEKYSLARPYTKKDYFFEIPDNEVVLNPNLANNNAELN